MQVPFYRHNVGEKEIEAVNEVLRSVFLTTGEVTKEFEEKFARYLGVDYVIGVSSCTEAMFLLLKAQDIGEGDYVITTPLSFIATANAIIHSGAIPKFVDVDYRTGNMNLYEISREVESYRGDHEEHTYTAIIPVHLYGHMVDMYRLEQIAARYGLTVIEDAAHAIEATDANGHGPACFSSGACFSFYATKNITCGEGGAIATNYYSLDPLLRQMRLHGMTKGAADRYNKKYAHYDMLTMGYKSNMTNMQAAMLLNQLDHIEYRLKLRESICKKYEEAFKPIDEIEFPQVLPDYRSARHLFTIWVDPKRRDTILHKLQDAGVGVSVNFRPIHLMEYYKDRFGYRRGDFPMAERIGDSTITLPLYPSLTDNEVEYVIEQTIKAVK